MKHEVVGDTGATWRLRGPPVVGPHALVYRAEGPGGLAAAVKLARLPGRDGAWVEDEAEDLRAWGEHPTAGRHVLPLLDVGRWEGRWFHVTPWRTPLSARLGEGDPAARRSLARHLVAAACAVREAGLAHPNLHPGNVFLDEGAVFFADLGERPLLRAADATTGLRATATSIAPEHALGLGPGDDVFGLAACVFAVLVGRPPEAPVVNALTLTPRGRAWMAGGGTVPTEEALDLRRCAALTSDDRRALAQVAAPDLVDAIAACLAPDPRVRLRDPARLLAALDAPVAPVTPPRRRASARAALAAFTLLAAALALIATRPRDPPPVPPPPAYPTVRVPPGAFTMGSLPDDPDHTGDERAHPVTITRPFLLGVKEVTQAQWAALLGANPTATATRRWGGIVHGPCSPYEGVHLVGDELPAVCVSWLDAVRLANAWSARDGLAPAYRVEGDVVTWDRDADGWRLPTEAEWEYAARADAAAADPCTFANFRTASCDDGAPGLLPVGRLRPNARGLHDLLGNAQEWVWDRYGPYPAGPVTDPIGPDEGTSRVSRGGSWYRGPRTVAWRSADPADVRAPSVGVRLARNAADGL